MVGRELSLPRPPPRPPPPPPPLIGLKLVSGIIRDCF